jgi:uncharacterized protein YecE (DUF72 family)
MLDHYSGFFDTVEINATYYRILHPRVMEHMVRKTPEDFRFFVKLHGSMTHSRDATDEQWNEYSRMLEPLHESGKLEGLLAQFPYSFRLERAGLDYLRSLSDRVAGQCPETALAVEFRNSQWYSPPAEEALVSMEIAPVAVDLPDLRNLPPGRLLPVGRESGPGYVRFHGRNARTWWKGGGERYDWDYSREELSGWLPAIEELAGRFPMVFLFFNNCHAGQAVRSSRLMMDLLQEKG